GRTEQGAPLPVAAKRPARARRRGEGLGPASEQGHRTARPEGDERRSRPLRRARRDVPDRRHVAAARRDAARRLRLLRNDFVRSDPKGLVTPMRPNLALLLAAVAALLAVPVALAHEPGEKTVPGH